MGQNFGLGKSADAGAHLPLRFGEIEIRHAIQGRLHGGSIAGLDSPRAFA